LVSRFDLGVSAVATGSFITDIAAMTAIRKRGDIVGRPGA
jgi:hypothetical protein